MDRNRHLAKLKDKLPEEMPNRKIFFRSCNAGHERLIGENWIDPGCPYCKAEKLTAERDSINEDAMTTALRLYEEDDDTFSPETYEVMKRWRPLVKAAIGKERNP